MTCVSFVSDFVLQRNQLIDAVWSLNVLDGAGLGQTKLTKGADLLASLCTHLQQVNQYRFEILDDS